jgi:hypothetical protein
MNDFLLVNEHRDEDSIKLVIATDEHLLAKDESGRASEILFISRARSIVGEEVSGIGDDGSGMARERLVTSSRTWGASSGESGVTDVFFRSAVL